MKVAILGGGVGGITAAFELSRPELCGRFEVTVYQLGWRLGGKGASGRNTARGDRIEEHGLHMWFGFYANAFAMMREAYEAIGMDVGDAFEACPQVDLYDKIDGCWQSHSVRMPRCGNDPWIGEPAALPTLFAAGKRALRWGLAVLAELNDGPGVESAPQDAIGALERAEQLATAHDQNESLGQEAVRATFADMVKEVCASRDALADAWRNRLEGPSADVRLRAIFTTLDVLAAASAGILRDGVLTHGFGAIDNKELSDWLKCNGASQLTLGKTFAERASVLRAIYDIAFSFPKGDVRHPNASAGTATSDLLKMLLCYRGESAYKMTTGMGDAIFAPLYEVLRRRGVQFRFFHAVTELHPSKDGTRVEQVHVIPQVALEGDYQPLITSDKGQSCWPHLPLWDQLPPEAKRCGRRFETEFDPLGRAAIDVRTLRCGEDFDDVVLAVPVGALATTCGPLMTVHKPFDTMVRSACTVRTQAFQLWLRRPAQTLGFRSVGSSFVEPLDTYSDMTQLLPAESGGAEIEGIAYVCGVLDDREGESAYEATERVKENALEYLDRAAPLVLPDICWDDLVDPQERRGAARFDAQYWRANTADWERYVISPAGSAAARLRSDCSGFCNLLLAGDWTDNGINGGCVEAAVISGKQAARALTQAARKSAIVGEHPDWLTRGGDPTLPKYREFGFRSSYPGPFHCSKGDMRMFVLDADADRIACHVHDILDQPAGRVADYRPVSSRVILLYGYNHVASMVAPWDEYGGVDEVFASFWIPVWGGHSRNGVFEADRLCMSIPYMLVNNPMSLVTGREVYGFAKAAGRFVEQTEERLKVCAYGGNLVPTADAHWCDLLEVPRVDGTRVGPETAVLGMADFVRCLGERLVDGLRGEGRGLPGGIRLAAHVCGTLLSGRTNLVFLKQFRDVADATRACYQEVVEAPSVTRNMNPTVEHGDWQVTLQTLDSHPIVKELGLETQRTGWSARLRNFEFDVLAGHVIGP